VIADWHFALGLAMGVALGLAAAVGIAAIRTGWLPRRARGSVVRRRLWGWATLVLTASLALQPLALALFGPGPVQFAASLMTGAGMITGVVMRNRAMRDRRRGPATTPAS
jgi:predicted lysophospholipase L1 biosynthesis ABC-type transport system permease subunit